MLGHCTLKLITDTWRGKYVGTGGTYHPLRNF